MRVSEGTKKMTEATDTNLKTLQTAATNLGIDNEALFGFLKEHEEDLALRFAETHGRRVWVADDGDGNAEVEMEDARTRGEAAKEYVDGGDWNEDEDTPTSTWVHVYTWPRYYVGDDWIDDDDERDSETIEIEPKAPKCKEGHEHSWHSPHDIVGGLEDNPGVIGNGGGAIIMEVCRHCGCGRTTDTWAQDPSTGEQGLHSVTYHPDGFPS